MIDTQALRNKLLSLALEGKLLNDFEKGNTDNELIAELKSINPKATLQFQAKDLPFHIPDNWNWVILGDIFAHNTGKALNSSNGEGVERRYITTSNVYWDHFDLSSVKTMFFKTEEIDGRFFSITHLKRFRFLIHLQHLKPGIFLDSNS